MNISVYILGEKWGVTRLSPINVNETKITGIKNNHSVQEVSTE